MSIVDAGAVAIQRASQRMETVAQNMANATTPGYKAQRLFDILITASELNQDVATNTHDWTQGKLQNTSNPLDLAISGAGFFVLRSESGDVYTRNGQFHLDGEGRLLAFSGLPVQSESGEIRISSENFEVTQNGMIIDNGEPIAQIRLVSFEVPGRLQSLGSGIYANPTNAHEIEDSSVVMQGKIEASNISTADEMIALMAAMRNAESGQRLVQVYDELMGRALTAFGQA